MNITQLAKALQATGFPPRASLRCPKKGHWLVNVWEMPGDGGRVAAVRTQTDVSSLMLSEGGGLIFAGCKCNREGFGYEISTDWLIRTHATVALEGSGGDGRWRFVRPPNTPTTPSK